MFRQSTCRLLNVGHRRGLEFHLDGDVNQATIQSYLRKRRIPMAGGLAARAFLAQDGSFDLAITDMAMPDMTGIELANRIEPLFPTLPIILSSGFAEISQDFQTALTRLPKSFDQSALAKVIAETMRIRTADSR